MYNSKYSQVSKYSPEAKKRMQYRSKGKSCGYYMRIVFFFSSLIQSLIIISLVLFLIYGKKQDSASTSRIRGLEESYSELSIENMALKLQRKNLTTFLNTTLTEKARNDWDLARLRDFTNISVILIQDMDKRLIQCNGELNLCKSKAVFNGQCPIIFSPIRDDCNCGLRMEQLRARLELVESNFTQTAQRMRIDMDQITKERDNLNLEAIRLRRDKSTHEKEVDFLKQKCKEDFAESLSGVSHVTTSFLTKIDSLFPTHIPFQLTCPKQREHLEQIRTNCSSLSRELEDRFQRYLNSVGDQVSSIQSESSRLKAENWRLSEDYRWCSQNRTGLIQQHKQNQDKLQQKHDQEKEKLLIDKMKLHGEIEVLDNNVKYKTKEVEHLLEQIKHLNLTCMSRVGFAGGFGGGQQPRASPGGFGQLGGGSSSSSFGQLNKPGSGLTSNTGSFGSPYKPNNAAGSSSSSVFSSGSSNSGYGSNKPASTGYGSSSSSQSSSGSSNSGYGSNKPASTGYGSSSSSQSSSGSSNSGYGSNKPASTGYGSSSSSQSSSGSSNSGYGSNKPASSGSGSSLYSSGSSSSSASASKPASSGSGSSLFSSGSSNSGYGSNKPASSGSGSSLFSSGSSSSSASASKPASSGSGSSLFPSGSSSSSGSGSSKPASSGYGSSSSSSSRSSPGIGSSSSSSAKSPSSSSSAGSTGSASKSSSPSSSAGGWFNSWGSSSSSSGQSKTGTGASKPSSTGSGSSFGVGRTSGLGGGPVSVAQHLRDLQRLINPPAPEEKQDLSRLLG